jgi:DNA-binding CsgD family transcriptional regulator
LRSEVAAESPARPEPPKQEELLTAREREIMLLVGSAMSNKEIARKLRISGNTVKTHLHHIYVKLNRSGRYKALLSEGAAPGPRRPFAGGIQPGRFDGG